MDSAADPTGPFITSESRQCADRGTQPDAPMTHAALHKNRLAMQARDRERLFDEIEKLRRGNVLSKRVCRNPCGPFCGPSCRKRCETTRNNTKGACQKLNRTNSFRHTPFQLRRV